MKKFGLTGNQLKLIGMALMTVDHVGFILLPQYKILRIIGRLAFPIFAYMIAEGCRYTRSMGRYLGLLAGFAAVSQTVEYLATGSLYQGIFVTFSLSVLLVWALKLGVEKRTAWAWLTAAAAAAGVFFVTRILPDCLPGTDFQIDYGLFGVILPVGIYFCSTQPLKLGFAAAAILAMYSEYGGIQIYALLSLPLLALYNGQRGKVRMKYLFYFYYPIHLAALHLLAIL